MSVRKSLFAAVLGLSAVGPAMVLAHHSHGNYDLHEYTYLTGTVQEVLWLNPHSWIHLRVTDEAGSVTDWALEGGGINALTRGGWKPDDIKPGDEVSVRCHRLRDGSQGCLMGYVTPKGGVEKEWD